MPISSRFEYCTQRAPHPRAPRNGPTQRLPNPAAPVRRLCMRDYTTYQLTSITP
ncbi:hypothetical protein BC629DRAFT_1494255 [Irpex lacteus]|nr:hypothetical protein BC629DRAFT_1494255 [Irpex lacteus]